MKRKGFTLIELLVVVAIIALLISILLPSLAKARELSKQTACQANVKSIGTAMYIYQEDNKGVMATPAHKEDPGTADPEIVFYGGMGGSSLLDRVTPSDGTSTNVPSSRGLWMLVRQGGIIPKNFICPSSEDEIDPTVDVQTYFDFIGFGSNSYSWQVPYDDTNAAKPTVDMAPKVALVADASPYKQQGDLAVDGNGSDFGDYFQDDLDLTFADALWTKMTTADPEIGCGDDDFLKDDCAPDKWKNYNSPNHGGTGQGLGQSVLYPDAHAEFRTKPTAGQDTDNIYTRMDDVQGKDEDFWKAMQWGSKPDAGLDTVYPGFKSLDVRNQLDVSAMTDSMLY